MQYVFGFPKLGKAIYAKGMTFDVEALNPFSSKVDAAQRSKKIIPESPPRVFKLVPVKLKASKNGYH